ncbi:MAG: fucose isomerase [Lachnospiraceae bacterium]|nr:fucose isomerase [Lachnospiraceae bacterium]MBR0152530.1 fucose isomerase [Lachnospiraceae bacterium]
MSYQILYCPIGVPTFHLESAQIQFDKSVSLLKHLSCDVVCPEKMLLSIQDLCAFLEGKNPDLIILQNITFANAAYASEILHRTGAPVMLWTLREPVIDGGRLRLNSLTGAYSAANTMRQMGRRFSYVFGSPDEAATSDKLAAAIRAAMVKKDLQGLRLTSIGHTPQGFGFGRAADLDLLRAFGVTLESIEARELINKAKSYTDEECAPYLEEARTHMGTLADTPQKNVADFARLYKAYKDYVTENHVGAVSSRCWPDFFTDFGTPVCAVLSVLNDLGVYAACEADTYGALSMYIGGRLTGSPCFFGDPVSLDEEANTVTFWHCGMASCALARKDTGATVGVHPNRKIGPAMDFGCEACESATIFRVGRDADGSFRFLVSSGKILDKPKQFIGTSLVVELDASAQDFVCQSVQDGWEPHYVVTYGDCAEEIQMLGRMLGIPVYEY